MARKHKCPMHIWLKFSESLVAWCENCGTLRRVVAFEQDIIKGEVKTKFQYEYRQPLIYLEKK